MIDEDNYEEQEIASEEEDFDEDFMNVLDD
jgi:hypothetical protein